ARETQPPGGWSPPPLCTSAESAAVIFYPPWSRLQLKIPRNLPPVQVRRKAIRNLILLRCGIGALLLWPTYSCCAQVVKIRIVSGKDGQPLKKQPVLVSFLYESKEKTPPDLRPTMQADTDANGEVSFHLPEPAPAHFGAQIRLTSENWRCACY